MTSNSANSLYEGIDVGGSIFKPDPGEQKDFAVTEVTIEPSKFADKNGKHGDTIKYVGLDADETEVTWFANNTDALRQCVAAKPEVGDVMRVKRLGDEAMSGGLNPAKRWEIKVLRRKGEVELDEAGFPVDY